MKAKLEEERQKRVEHLAQGWIEEDVPGEPRARVVCVG